jgi:hypothetical protein
MNRSEFEERVFANPSEPDSETLSFAQSSKVHQALLDEVRVFDEQIQNALRGIPVPDNLVTRLKNNINSEQEGKVKSLPFLRKYRSFAMAAALALGVGISYSLLFNTTGPSAEELAFGQDVLRHVHLESAMLEGGADINLQSVNQVMSFVGGQLLENDSTRSLHISFAKPCYVAARSPSAHIVIVGERGSVNVFLIESSPVHEEFPINDERFTGTVVPTSRGNLVLIGEKNDSLNGVRKLVTENIIWSI